MTLKLYIIVIVAVMHIACNSHEIYVGNDCNDSEVAIIEEALDIASAHFKADIYIAGRTSGSHFNSSENDRIFCEHDKNIIFYNTVDGEKLPLFGHEQNGTMVVFSHLIDNNNTWKSTLLHELGHYMGLDDNDDKKSIMYWGPQSEDILTY